MEDLEEEYGIKGRPLKIALDRIAEDEEGGNFDLPPVPSHKDRFDSAHSCAGPQFSTKAPHPGLRNLNCADKGPATASSSKHDGEVPAPESPSGETTSTSGITTQSGDADDESSSVHLQPLNESTSSVDTFLSVSSRIRDRSNFSSLISVASYHTALTGPDLTHVGTESVLAVSGPSSSTAPCTRPKNPEAGPSKKVASTTIRKNASNEQPTVGEPVATESSRTDPEIASLKSKKGGTPNRYQQYWYALPWAISWLTTLVLLCAFIVKNHDPLTSPKLSGGRHDKTKRMIEANATSWMAFHHNATFVFNIQWPGDNSLNDTVSNTTGLNTRTLMGRDRVTPIAWGARSNETWDPMLYIEHVQMLNSSWVTVNTSLTAQHSVNLAAVCPLPSAKDIKESATPTSSIQLSMATDVAEHTTSAQADFPTSSTTLQPPASATRPARPATSGTSKSKSRSRWLKETRAVTYAKNLLTCLWFLPVWLFAIFVVQQCRITWLEQAEGRIRMQIIAVVLSFLLAAALALATTEVLVAVVNSTRDA